MSISVKVFGDSEYSRIRFFKLDNVTCGRYSMGAQLYKIDGSESDISKRVFFEYINVSRSIDYEIYGCFCDIISGNRNGFNVSIARRNGEVSVTVRREK
jgi:hypothetical protein